MPRAIDLSVKTRIIELMAEHNNYTIVAEILGISKVTVGKRWRHNADEGSMANRYANCRREPLVTDEQKLDIKLKSIEDPFLPTTKIKTELESPFSLRTIRNVLRGMA